MQYERLRKKFPKCWALTIILLQKFSNICTFMMISSCTFDDEGKGKVFSIVDFGIINCTLKHDSSCVAFRKTFNPYALGAHKSLKFDVVR